MSDAFARGGRVPGAGGGVWLGVDVGVGAPRVLREPAPESTAATEDPPLFTEPVVGYRAWRVDLGGSVPALAPMAAWHGGLAWQPGVNRARCAQDASGSHTAPMADCGCGLYAHHQLQQAPTIGAFSVRGAVVGWGAIEVHATGWRAECAQVVALLDDGRPWALCAALPERYEVLLDALAKRYDVPIVPDEAALEAAALEHGAPLPRDVIPEAAQDPITMGMTLASRQFARSVAVAHAAGIRVAADAVKALAAIAPGPPSGGAPDPVFRARARASEARAAAEVARGKSAARDHRRAARSG